MHYIQRDTHIIYCVTHIVSQVIYCDTLYMPQAICIVAL